jgi:hypothetical protein
MRKPILLAAALALELAACTSSLPAPQSPAQAVYESKLALADQIAIEVEYATLPRCVTGAPALCSSPATMKAMHDARLQARATLNVAEGVVTGKITGVAPSAAVAQAQAAIAAYAETTATVKVK